MGRISLHLVVLAAKEPHKLLCQLSCNAAAKRTLIRSYKLKEFYKIDEMHKCGWLQADRLRRKWIVPL